MGSITIIKLSCFIIGMAKIQVNQYFEGVLQLRNCNKEILDFITETIGREKGNVWVAKEVKTKEGIDLYISSNKFLKRIGKMLKEKFHGIVKSTSKLHTRDRQTGKKVYRGTVLFRMPNFKLGEIGMLHGDEIKILLISNKVNIKYTKTGTKKQYKFDEINKNFRAL